MRLGIAELYFGASGKKGFYNSQEIGLAKAMKKLGYDVTIFYPNPELKTIEEEPVEMNIKIVYVPAKIIGVHSKYDWSVLKKYQIEVVQLGSDNQIFAPDIISYCDKNHILLYSYIGTTGSDSRSVFKRFILNRFYRRNISSYKKHMCFAKTPTVKRQLEAFGIEQIALAPVGLDTEVIPSILESKVPLRKKLNVPLKKTVLLFVGRMDEYKRPFEAIKLADIMRDKVCLIMIGTGSLDEIIADEIANRKLDKQIIRIKSIPNREVQEYYVACDFCLNFNKKEIFGMSVLEAMYHGCTVLACHAPGPDFIIEDKVSGYLLDDASEMQGIIEQKNVLNPEIIKARVLENFVWDKTATIFHEWIKKN